MATRSMSTEHSRRHLYQNIQVIRRSTIMDCGDGITDHNSTVQRTVSRHVDPSNNQNQYQWRASVKTQPPKTILHPSVLVRPHPQNKYAWRNPEASRVPTQAFKQEREITLCAPMQTSQEQSKSHSRSVIPVDVNSNPVASGSGVRSQSLLAKSSFQIKEEYDNNSKRFVNGRLELQTINTNNRLSRNMGFGKVSPLNPSTPEGFGKVSPLNRFEHHERTDGGWGTNQIRKYPIPGLSQSNPWTQPNSEEKQKFEERVFDNFNNNSLSRNKGFGKISPLRRPTPEGFGQVSPLNRHGQHVRTDGGRGTDQIRKYPIPGLSHFKTISEEKQKFEERVFARLNLLVEKPWSVQDIEDMRRLLSYNTTLVPPEPSLEGLEPETLVYVEPIRWLSDNSERSFVNDEISRKQRAPYFDAEIDTTSKLSKLNAPSRINRKRRASDEDNLDTEMVPLTKRSRLM